MKKVYSKRTKVKTNKKNVFFPFTLILFILITIYSFILGDNGFYSHKNKLKSISQLKKDNRELIQKIADYNEQIEALKSGNSFAIEKEARLIPLKKQGDKIIKLYNEEWIANIANKSQWQNIHNEQNETRKSFFGHYKIVISIMTSLIIAFILTFMLPRFKKRPYQNNSQY